MKKKITSILAVVLVIALTLMGCSSKVDDSAQTSQETETDQQQDTEDEAQDSETEGDSENQTAAAPERFDLHITAESLKNNKIDEAIDQGISVHLPAGYETSGKEYPVLYFLPGFSDSYLTYMDTFAEALNTRYQSGETVDLIVVTINGINKLGGSFYVNSETNGNWEDFVTKDVVNYIDTNYRTKKEAAYRGIAGHSMGGTAVLTIAMHTDNLFGYIYAMSPGLFAQDGLQQCDIVNYEYADKFIEDNSSLANEEIHQAYMDYAAQMEWPVTFAVAYGSAFAPDAEGRAPYILIPGKDESGNYMQDDVMKLYEAGFGNNAEKIEQGKDRLKAMKGILIEYGTEDEFPWIPAGDEYVSSLLKSHDIAHELVTYAGGHQSMVNSRIGDTVLDYFINAFNQ